MKAVAPGSILTGEYLTLWLRAQTYGKAIDISQDYLNECMSDLEEILYTAQSRSVPVEKIIGRDEGEFCRSYFSAFTLRDRLENICAAICKTMWAILVFSLAMFGFALCTMGAEAGTLSTGRWIGIFLAFDLVHIVFYTVLFSSVMRRVFFRIRHQEKIRAWAVVVEFALAVLVASFIDGAIEALPGAVFIGISAVYLTAYYGIRAAFTYGSTGHFKARTVSGEIRQHRRYENRRARDMAFVHEVEKIWSRKNTKREKRGLPALSKQEFWLWFRGQTKKSKTTIAVAWVLCVLWIVAQVIACVILQVDTEPVFALSVVDSGMLGGLLFVAWAFRDRIRLEQECIEKGITILDYTG